MNFAFTKQNCWITDIFTFVFEKCDKVGAGIELISLMRCKDTE